MIWRIIRHVACFFSKDRIPLHMGPLTRERVLRIMDEQGFVPGIVASALAAGSRFTGHILLQRSSC